ncbi:MAG TPA: hypothetical protein VF053_03390 [Streptosporangiales bacterium]
MSSLTAPTEVFAAETDGRCAVVFLARLRHLEGPSVRRRHGERVAEQLDRMADAGWSLSVDHVFGGDNAPTGYASGFAHDVDVVGAFEAPNAAEALEGTVALEDAGWAALARTEWLLGVREFAPTPAEHGDRPWGFVALWQWNDAWQAASADEVRAYDADCDVAFRHDLDAGARIAGRHRLDWASRWHHVGIWETPTFAMLDRAMRDHERVADFAFTTSRHYVGRRAPLVDLLVEGHHA